MEPTELATNFSRVPADIHFFINHPIIAKALDSRLGLFFALVVSLALAYVGARFLAHRTRRGRLLAVAFAFAAIGFFSGFRVASSSASFARNPTSATIIAAIVHGKAITGPFFARTHYLIVKIENDLHGVATTRAIWEDPSKKPGATFDYSLYTYATSHGDLMYRFLNPPRKLPPARGNLQ